MKSKNIAFLSFLLLSLAIAIGAIGSHMLKPLLSEACYNTFDTASKYHFYITFALLTMASLSFGAKIYFSWSLSIVLVGMSMFVGGCYLSAFREIYTWGIYGSKAAPVGGVFLILGFMVVGIQCFTHKLK